jgi:hypothetical protein
MRKQLDFSNGIRGKHAAGRARMTINQIKETHSRQPFQPFYIHLADGRTLEVPHPEFLYIPPKGDRCIFVTDDDGTVEWVDLLLVVSLKPMKSKSDGQRRRKAG